MSVSDSARLDKSVVLEGDVAAVLSVPDPSGVTWPPVPWERARQILAELYALDGDQFAAVIVEWQRSDPDYLDHLGDKALLALRMAVEAECQFRFGRARIRPG